ncbi:MAG: ABC transporter permease [Thermoflexales bacterium]|nr:ABC transporter permease [Thermoflexales bacterium]
MNIAQTVKSRTLRGNQDCVAGNGRKFAIRDSHSTLYSAMQHKRAQVIIAPIAVMLFLGAWASIVRLSQLPPYILPGPDRVWTRLLSLGWPTLLYHAGMTASEVLSGLALGMAVAFSLGYVLARSVLLERLLAPYLVASQSVPTVAIAPILVIWVGTGRLSKVLVAALIVFFPILINTITGLRGADPGLRELMRSLRATRWQMLTKLEIPAALPVLLSGLKVGATLSVIGAVVGEFVGADRGLGFLVNQGQGLYDTALMFVAVLTLATMSISLYSLVTLIEYWLLAWKRET